MYKNCEMKRIKEEAAALQLKYPAEFADMPCSTLAGIANGYGPERWPENLRKLVTWIFRHYPAPAAIHDVPYEFSDGSELTRKAADAEFAANLKIVWKYYYGRFRWVNIIALYGFFKIFSAAAMTRRFGRSAWLDSFRKKHSGKEVRSNE